MCLHQQIMMTCLIFLTGFLLIQCGEALNLNHRQNNLSNTNNSDDISKLNSNFLTLSAINVGQGDSTLLITPTHKAVLIDGGPQEHGLSAIKPLLERWGVHELHSIIISHYDSDHIGGIPELMRGPDEKLGTLDDLNVSYIYDRGEPQNTDLPFYDDYLQSVGQTPKTLTAGDIIEIDEYVTLECIIINGVSADGHEIKTNDDDENGKSSGLLISYKGFHYFTAGDLPGGGPSGSEDTIDFEKMIMSLVGPIDVLHVSHHGSETSSSLSFLQTLTPTVALISVGNENPFGHPSPTVLHRLDQIGATIYQTGKGAGEPHPSAHILNDSITIFVNEDGSYQVNGNEYMGKE